MAHRWARPAGAQNQGRIREAFSISAGAQAAPDWIPADGEGGLARLPQLAGFARANYLIFRGSGSKGRHYKTISARASITLPSSASSSWRISEGMERWRHCPIELPIRKGQGRHYRRFQPTRVSQINDLGRQNRSKSPKTAASCGSRVNACAQPEQLRRRRRRWRLTRYFSSQLSRVGAAGASVN